MKSFNQFEEYVSIILAVGLMYLSGISAVNAQDDLIFESGPPDSSHGLRISDIQPFYAADDFIVTDGGHIESVVIWTSEMPDMFQWDGTIKYYIFLDSSGTPSGSPIYQGEAQSIIKEADPSVNTMYLGYRYAFNFEEPLELNENTVYWLAINMGGGGTIETTQAFWHATTNRVLTDAMVSTDLTTWNPYYFNLAFQLYSDSVGHKIVAIDIKPNNESNNINPSSNGSLSVAILTTEDFDALQVDPMTVQFGPAGAVDSHRRAHAKDVDDDGDIDLLFHFRTPETGIQCGDTEAVLMGETWDGASIRGTDSVNTVGCEADKLTYIYRGNSFEEVDGLIFTTNDRVTAQFTIDCAAAHSAGNCANLPYDNYLQLGAVELEPLSFLAGPAGLPTSNGEVEIAQFSFSTDSTGRIVDWDMDLFLFDPSGVINVDTDNRIGGPIDSAAALGGIAVVRDNPGEWIVEKAISRKVIDKIKGIQKKDKKNKN